MCLDRYSTPEGIWTTGDSTLLEYRLVESDRAPFLPLDGEDCIVKQGESVQSLLAVPIKGCQALDSGVRPDASLEGGVVFTSDPHERHDHRAGRDDAFQFDGDAGGWIQHSAELEGVGFDSKFEANAQTRSTASRVMGFPTVWPVNSASRERSSDGENRGERAFGTVRSQLPRSGVLANSWTV